MKCIYCKGPMERGKSPFQIERDAYLVTLQAVPAWICTQCREVYFDQRAVQAIEHMIHALDKGVERMALTG